MAAPKPLPVSTSPSLGPAAARAATQDAQIAQLVQQIRTLESSLSQQRAQLRAEKARGIDAVNQIKDRWKSERKEWRDGCDALQAKHRLAHLGTRVALEHERGLRLEDKEALTREKIATLLREYKITLFQARETELVAHVAALEGEIEVQREQLDQILTQHEAEIAGVSTKLAESEVRWQKKSEEHREFAQEKGELEAELTALRTSSASNAKQVDRLTLLVETLSTQKATAETHNKDLQHQVDKWQSLAGKGEKEVEALRKRRIELEVRVKELEVSLKEAHGFDKKTGKLEASLLEVQEQVEQGQRNIAEAQAEADQARKMTAKLEKQVTKLQAALEAEKTRSADALEKEKGKFQGLSKPASKARPRVPSVIEEVSEGEISQETPPKPRTRNQKPASTRSEKADTKGKAREKATRLPSEAADEPQRKNGKEQAQQNVLDEGELLEIEDEDSVQETSLPVKKRGRPRGQDLDSEIEEVPPPPKNTRSKAGQSRRSEDDTEATKKPRFKPDKRKEVDDDELPKKRARDKPPSTSAGQGAAKPPSTRVDTEEEEGPQKKKKRKLNLAGGNIFAGPAGFTWNQDGEGDLGIPSVLSPVKDGQPVPSRSSGSSSLLSGWKVPWG